MRKLKLIGLITLIALLAFTFYGCKETSKYKISDVKGAQNLKIEKDKAYISFDVNGSNEFFDIKNIIISKGTVVAYLDKECNNEKDLLPLKEGLNTFYFKVRLNKNDKLLKTVWTLNINRLPVDDKNTTTLYSFDTLYNVGSEFKGGIIKEVTNDGINFIEITLDMVEGFNTSKEGTYDVVITYGNMTFKTKISVLAKDEMLIPTYDEISESTLSLESIRQEVLKTLIKCRDKISDAAIDEAVKAEIKAETDLYENAMTLGYMFYKAGVKDTELTKLLNLIYDNFYDYTESGELSDIIENILSLVRRVVKTVSHLDSVLTQEQIGALGYAYYQSELSDYLETSLLLTRYKDDPLFEKLNKMYEETNKEYLSRNEVMYLTINAFSVIKRVSSSFNDNYTNIISVVEKVTSGEKFTNTDLSNVRGMGEFIQNISYGITQSTLDVMLEVLEHTFSFYVDDLSEYFEQKQFSVLISNSLDILQFIGGYLNGLNDETVSHLNNLVELIMLFSDYNSIFNLSTEELYSLAESLIIVSKEIVNHYNTLTPLKQKNLKLSVNALLTSFEIPISMQDVVNLIEVYAKENPDKVNLEEAVVLLEMLASRYYVKEKLDIEYLDDVILSQNATIDEVLEILKESIIVKLLTLEGDYSYKENEVELTTENILNLDTKTPGFKTLTINVGKVTKELIYFVSPLKHDFVLSIDSAKTLDFYLVFDQDKNCYFATQDFTLVFFDRITGFNYDKSIDIKKINYQNLDISKEGIFSGLVEVDAGEYGTYILPINYYVINTIDKKITDQIVDFNQQLIKGFDSDLSGNIKVEFNSGINVFKETVDGVEEFIYNFNNVEYYYFNKSNIEGLDINKAGTQQIKIVVEGVTITTEIKVYDEDELTDIESIDFYLEGIYKDCIDVTKYLSVTITTKVKSYSLNYSSYEELLKDIKRFKLPYELSFEKVTEEQNLIVYKLTVKDLKTNQTFEQEKNTKVVSKEDFFSLYSINVFLDVTYFPTDDENLVFDAVSRIYLSGKYINLTLEGSDASSWLKENATCTFSKDNNFLTIEACGATTRVFDVHFEATQANTFITFNIHNTLPSFMKEFSDEDIFNAIIESINIGSVIYSNRIENIYPLFKTTFQIEKSNDTIKVILNNEVIKIYNLVDVTADQITFNWVSLGHQILLDDLNKENLIDRIDGIFITVEIDSNKTYIFYQKHLVTDTLLDLIEITAIPNSVGENNAFIKFINYDLGVSCDWYTERIEDVIKSFLVYVPFAIYKGEKTVDDFTSYVQNVTITYTNGKQYHMPYDEILGFLKNECRITINNNNTVTIEHLATGVKYDVDELNITWYDLNKMEIAQELSGYRTSISIASSDDAIDDPYNVLSYISIAFVYDQKTAASIYLPNRIAKTVGCELLNIKVVKLFRSIYITYTINGIEYKLDTYIY